MRTLALILAISLQEKAPDPPAIADAEKTVRELFKDDYAKKAPKDRLLFGQKLLQQARQSKDSPASQYVLLREAQDNLSQGGDLNLSLETIDEWSRLFVIDAVDLKVKAIGNAAKLAKTPEEGLAIGAGYLKVADAAALADRFDVAEKQVQAAMAMARKASNVPAVNRATARSKELVDQKAAFEKLKKSRDALAANAEDPEANLAVGKYQCFTKGNWEAGLPLLAKGGDAALKDLAFKDLSNPSQGEAQVEVGDGWWDLSPKLTGPGKLFSKARASSWYEKASPQLQGLAKTKADQRASEHYLAQLFQGNWIDTSPKFMISGTAPPTEPPPTGPYGMWLKPPPGSEYDAASIRIRANGNAPGVIMLQVEMMPQLSFYLSFEINQLTLMVKEGGSQKMEKAVPFQPKNEHVMTVVFTEGAAVVYLDGREQYRYQTDSRLVTYVYFSRPRGTCIMDQMKLRKKG